MTIGWVVNKEKLQTIYFGLFILVTFYLFGFIEVALAIGQSRVFKFLQEIIVMENILKKRLGVFVVLFVISFLFCRSLHK